MQNIGIIAEFNPFHSGHKYLLDCIKGDDTTVTVVMSGNFVQRGDTALMPKAARAAAALKNGADLVIDLPTPWAMSTAQNFAFGGVSLLKNLGNIDGICFGSECGDIDLLRQTADILKSEEFSRKISDKLGSGETFAKIRSDVIKLWGERFEKVLTSPNDTLATEYIFAAFRLNFDTEFACVKRVGASHDSSCSDITASASLIRKSLLEGDTSLAMQYIPESAHTLIKTDEFSSIKNIEKAILADLRVKAATDGLKNIADASEGIENRIKTAIMKAGSLDELYALIKSKRYTLARVRRLVLSAYLGIDASFYFREPPYIRVLGFTKKGEQILKDAKKKVKCPIITTAADIDTLTDFGKKVWLKECIATDIFSLSLTIPQGCGNEYYHKIIKET